MSNETFVAFATQKGGIGKSTVTALAANYLHNVKGHNVAVIDCDAPQHSIHGLRERETGLIGESLYFKALACDHFRKIRKNAYPVIASDALNALDDAERMLAAEEVKPDVVFFSLPSTIVQNRYSPFVFACPVVMRLSRNITANCRVLSTTKRSALMGAKM